MTGNGSKLPVTFRDGEYEARQVFDLDISRVVTEYSLICLLFQYFKLFQNQFHKVRNVLNTVPRCLKMTTAIGMWPLFLKA